MTEISYERLVEKALLHVVRDALLSAEKNGLDGNHFYITFQTNRDDVILSERLKASYPKDMTIVLQHEFYDLKTDEDKFSVTLSFNNISERISVPFGAVTRFADLRRNRKRLLPNKNPIRKTLSVSALFAKRNKKCCFPRPPSSVPFPRLPFHTGMV